MTWFLISEETRKLFWYDVSVEGGNFGRIRSDSLLFDEDAGAVSY